MASLEAILRLTDDEVDVRERLAVLSDMVLVRTGKCPTLLHSLAHLDKPCPCGCLDKPCPCDIVAVAAPVCPLSGWPAMAFLPSSCDVDLVMDFAFLIRVCTLPPTFQHLDSRAALPLIGQTAAPTQAQWVALALKQAIHRHHGAFDLEITELVRQHTWFQEQLRNLAFHLWPTDHTAVPRATRLRFDSGGTSAIQVAAHATIHHLI